MEMENSLWKMCSYGRKKVSVKDMNMKLDISGRR